MAAYAATVTLNSPRAHREAGRDGLGFVRGVINVTNYNQTLAELTDITGLFRDTPTVILGGCTDAGYLVQFDSTGKSVKAWNPTTQAEVANDTDIGAVEFIAFGRM